MKHGKWLSYFLSGGAMLLLSGWAFLLPQQRDAWFWILYVSCMELLVAELLFTWWMLEVRPERKHTSLQSFSPASLAADAEILALRVSDDATAEALDCLREQLYKSPVESKKALVSLEQSILAQMEALSRSKPTLPAVMEVRSLLEARNKALETFDRKTERSSKR